jgi:hypothetical protein
MDSEANVFEASPLAFKRKFSLRLRRTAAPEKGKQQKAETCALEGPLNCSLKRRFKHFTDFSLLRCSFRSSYDKKHILAVIKNVN